MKSKFDYAIIADFLSPCTKERIIYELSSPKKRIKAFERFSHSAETIIRAEYIYYKGGAIDDTIKSEIKKSVSECAVLSLEFQQGRSMSIEEAFDYLNDKCIFAIIVTENWLIIKPEYEGGGRIILCIEEKIINLVLFVIR